MTYKILGMKILIKRDPVLEQDGLYIPDDVRKPPRTGRVLSVGPLVTNVFVGERVVISEYAGNFLETTQDLTPSDLIVLRDHEEILAVYPPDQETVTS